MPLLVGQVCFLYPGEFREGEIAAPFFWFLCRQMRPILALQRVQTTDAVAKGAALVMSGEKVLPLLQADKNEAFPNG